MTTERDTPPPTTPGKPVDHASRQQRTKESSEPQRDSHAKGADKQPAHGATPPGAK